MGGVCDLLKHKCVRMTKKGHTTNAFEKRKPTKVELYLDDIIQRAV